MRQVVTLALLGFSYLLFGSELKEVKVSGQDNAQLKLVGDVSADSVTWKLSENTLDIVLPGTVLAKEHGDKIEITTPHSLIKRLSFINASNSSVKGKVIINGTVEDIQKRVNVNKVGNEIVFTVEYPKNNSSALRLLQEEQIPLAAQKKTAKNDSNEGYRSALMMITAFFLIVGIAGFVFVRFFRQKGAFRGARKYLIEQLGYCPVGAKAGVSLLKIGNDFVLVGITPNQISMLSHLPKLQEQYEEESGFERGVFKQAVAEEVKRLG
jgi:flagellar protein FliO/FliZ